MASKRKVNLTDYELTTTLGTGSFGRVMLCKNKKSGEYFAMKRLKKADIIKLRQVDHVISENTILADIDHPFLVSYHSKSYFNIGWLERILSRLQVLVLPYGVHRRWRVIYLP
jgi:serine/threonine protein kinase